MEFEYDPNKNRSNRSKHGIDVDRAQALWDDADRVEIPAPTEDEPRWLVIGRIDGVFYSAAVTNRQGRTRLISVRRSREEEVTIYED